MAHRLTRIALTLILSFPTTGLMPLTASPVAVEAASDKPTKPIQVDINSASLNELVALAGIGEAYANKIIEGRPLKRKDDLVKRKILPLSTYNKIKGRIVAKQK